MVTESSKASLTSRCVTSKVLDDREVPILTRAAQGKARRAKRQTSWQKLLHSSTTALSSALISRYYYIVPLQSLLASQLLSNQPIHPNMSNSPNQGNRARRGPGTFPVRGSSPSSQVPRHPPGQLPSPIPSAIPGQNQPRHANNPNLQVPLSVNTRFSSLHQPHGPSPLSRDSVFSDGTSASYNSAGVSTPASHDSGRPLSDMSAQSDIDYAAWNRTRDRQIREQEETAQRAEQERQQRIADEQWERNRQAGGHARTDAGAARFHANFPPPPPPSLFQGRQERWPGMVSPTRRAPTPGSRGGQTRGGGSSPATGRSSSQQGR